jgi:uncharacterized protein YqgC (DUF456 family)
MPTDLLVAFVLMGGLIVINTVGVAMVLLQMPGTWLIFFSTAAVAWFRWSNGSIGWLTLAVLLLLAVVGEIVETATAARHTRKAGGSWVAAIMAMIGAIFGAILGSFILPPVGTLAGACAGAGLGALGFTRASGSSWDDSRDIGIAAAKGRFWGTLAKVGIACVMWFVSLLAVVIP